MCPFLLAVTASAFIYYGFDWLGFSQTASLWTMGIISFGIALKHSFFSEESEESELDTTS